METVKKTPPKKPPSRKTPAAGGPKPAPRNILAVLGRKPSRKVAREMLLLETRRLRAIFTEIAERYLEETEGRIAAAISGIETKNLPEPRIRKMLETVQTLSVKARKGRRKDLARIEKVTEILLKALEE